MGRYALAVFDFDGTLVDASAAIVDAMNHALRASGRPERAPAEIRALVGTPLEEILDRLGGGGLSAAEVEVLRRSYGARFVEVARGATRVFDGVERALKDLRSAGVELAIATNRGRDSMEDILEHHGLTALFGARFGRGCVAKLKPDPEMLVRAMVHHGRRAEETLVIGDTAHDVRMAHAAGVHVCAVTYGAQSEADLTPERPTYLANTVPDWAALF
jgi:HAD superfamily hydrolase (TIGR01509 family)